VDFLAQVVPCSASARSCIWLIIIIIIIIIVQDLDNNKTIIIEDLDL